MRGDHARCSDGVMVHTSSLDIAGMSACDDHPVLNLEPRLGLPGGVGKEVWQKEDLLGNEIEGIERKNVVSLMRQPRMMG